MKKKYVIIGITSTSNWFVALLFLLFRKNTNIKIYFPYDIAFFRFNDYKKYSWIDRICEEYNFKHCDLILHKGPKEELKYLPKQFKTKNKKNIQLLPYCDEELMIEINSDYFMNKLSKKDGKIHLVYIGGVYHNNNFHYPTINIFREILNQNLMLHVYAINYFQIKDDVEYKNLQKNKLFRLHKPIYGKKLYEEISKYDWGLFIFNFNYEKISKLWAMTSFGNKVSSYLEAGIPYITNSEQKFVAEITIKNNFGIILNKTSEIKKKIEKINYTIFVEELKKTRSEFTLSKNIKGLLTFIDKK